MLPATDTPARRSARRGKRLTDDPTAAAKSAGLRYVNDDEPGITRVAAGKSFHYKNDHGRLVTDSETLGRIKRLAIPPAWTEVWISPRPDGHIQATGRDARGRKQYRYHPHWRATRDESKYERMIAFGKALPRIRARVARDLRRPGLGRNKVLAAMIRLLEATLVRVGNEEYVRANGSVGLSTMQDRHVKVAQGRLRFSFKGKSGRHHRIELHEPRLANIVRKVQDLPGQELFQYVDDAGQVHDIKSDDVNAYLREIAGEDFSAKDFRTWAGTVLAALALQQFEKFTTRAEAKKNLVAAIERVAERLGNTPAVCRKCYIHPVVLDSYLDGATVEVIRHQAEDKLQRLEELSGAEGAVLAFLHQRLRRPAAPPVAESLRRSIVREKQRRRTPTPRPGRDDRSRGGRDTSDGARGAAKSRSHRSPPSRRRRPGG